MIGNGVPEEPGAQDERDPYLSRRNGGAEIYLIRHADALPGPDEIVLDAAYHSQPLSELGRRQAAALAARLREVSLAAVYSSPILRARETATPCATLHQLEVRIEADLREVELGPPDPGPPAAHGPQELARTVRERIQEMGSRALLLGSWDSIPGSEPSAALRARATAVVDRLAAAHPGERIAVFSHGGTINAYIAAMLGLERDYFFPCANTAISVVRVKGGRRLLLALNDIGHLRKSDRLC